MFIEKGDVKNRISDIILDDKDNDIAFIVASKGIGKLSLLSEVFDMESSKRNIIVANGKRIRGSSSCLSKCFIDGICSYIERNNTRDGKTKMTFLNLLPRGKLSALQKISFMADAFVARRKVRIDELSLCLSGLTLNQLKEIYVGLAGETPLVLFAGAIFLTKDDIDFLCNLHNDNWGARVTYIIALRPTIECLDVIKSTIDKKKNGVWVFPLLPDIATRSKTKNPNSIASIIVNDIGKSDVYRDFQQALLSNTDYFEVYNLVHTLLDDGLQPAQLCFLANQEMSNSEYFDLKRIVSKIYPGEITEYDDRLIIPYDGRLLWLDALSYYIALCECIDDAISSTQNFFFRIIAYSQHFQPGSPERSPFISFLTESQKHNKNQIAEGFAAYFSSFAALAMAFSSESEFHKNSGKNSLMALDILDRSVLDFSGDHFESHIVTLETMHEYSQFCSILDIGLEAITRFFESGVLPEKISASTILGISNFQAFCMSTAYRWLDVTLIDKIILLQKSIRNSGLSVQFEFKQLNAAKEKEALFHHLEAGLKRENLELEDVIMRGTIFLSYSHSDSRIADMLEDALKQAGHDVKRDINCMQEGDSLEDFMKSIRKQDYVVFLVSDTYLRRVNCVNEVMQFMKDEDRISYAFPICIGFTQEELSARKQNNRPSSMFDDFYWMEIAQYWQNYSKQYHEQLAELNRENSAEFAMRYRKINTFPQTAAEFFDATFSSKLLATIDPENLQEEHIVKIASRIDHLIRSKISEKNCVSV